MASFTFPQDLLDAQTRLHETTAELQGYSRTLPWSVVPAEGYTSRQPTIDPETGERHNREFETTEGYTEEQVAEAARLQSLVLELSEQVYTHDYWQTTDVSQRVAARSALKDVTRPKADAA
ncbi:hypothetical protein OG897_13750 [Streptomyces sp. NBC_00237]|uniref:hypothetical protein n=1 Tax=Streptomyces sp. NBC_00237 TaxID=2975687 RepID=UPI002255E460|nr:hypothetical protein [Streptomyces sp. NBC_00237]MCX5202508.1 hypothetical protein [Streptomyces sp. NBC_00237]